MSAPQQNEGAEVPLEKKKGFEKYVEKFKRALSKSGSSSAQKRLSLSTAAKPAAAGSSAAAAAGASSSKEAAKPAAVAETSEIPTEDTSSQERVPKEARMRVHRECHECKKDFGGENVCGSCGHKRCKECARFPKKVDKDEDATINVVIEKPEKYRLQITKPARASKQDLVLKKPVQRVRRNCHCCGTLFYPPTKTCTECGHIRCTDCPRDPPKLRKYPYGYPNDVFGDKTAYYTCHECEKVFPLDEAKCANCTHEKCTECARAPPRKVEAQPDPEVLRRVEERLAQLALTSAAAES
ncbi:hypothetical protein V497_08555 [Pseudogymnoascus sp. VKM F-4516 (FW-969)]|nr:hypothetical protein V497_08555 [Pseudogymnoascus sp. VKM F-4516 (FW-969)]